MKTLVAVGILLTLPVATFAAGFAKQSLFLSQATVEQHETVYIYAVVTNDTTSYFNGKLVVSDQEGPIGTTTVSLDTGQANTVSVKWTPTTAGSHRINANLINLEGAVVEHEDYVFFVNTPAVRATASPNDTKTAKKSPQATTTQFDASTPLAQPIENTLARVSPSAAAGSKSAFSTIDSLRRNAVSKLDQGNQWSKKTLVTSSTGPGGFTNTLWLILGTLGLYTTTALTYAVSNLAIFYPVLFALFLFLLWRIFKLFRR